MIINISDIPNKQGLYILNIENKIIKVGRSTNLRKRISSYKIKYNIGYVLCDSSKVRENAMIYFIITEVKLKPVYGREYFEGDRLSFEKIVFFFSTVNLDYILKWCNDRNTDYFKGKLNFENISENIPQNLPQVNNDNLLLDLSYDKVLTIMKDIKPNLEEIDPGLFFIKNICTDKDGNVAIKCYDKRRKLFGLINKYKKEIILTGYDIFDLFIRCYYDYKYEDHINGENEHLVFQSQYKMKEFINRVVSLTYFDSPQCLIKKE